MARSRKPTPLHSRSRRVWQMSLTSAFVHWRLLKKFVVLSFYFTWDDFGFQTRLMISRKRNTQKKCVKLFSCFCLFLLGTLARCLRGLEIVWHCITQAIKKKEELSIAASKLEVRSLKAPQFGQIPSQSTRDCPVVNVSLCRTAGGRRRMLMPRSTAAHRCRVLYL